jgi:hypothetical protein
MSKGILNELSTFVDVVADTGVLSEARLRDLHLAIAAYGVVADVTVVRLARVINPAQGGGVIESFVTLYEHDRVMTPAGELSATRVWAKGDIIQVRVNMIQITGAQRMMSRFLRFYTPAFDMTLAGMIRK